MMCMFPLRSHVQLLMMDSEPTTRYPMMTVNVSPPSRCVNDRSNLIYSNNPSYARHFQAAAYPSGSSQPAPAR
jgi:hypothetical protein